MSMLLFDSFEDSDPVVVVSNLATAASIRDRIIALIAGQVPVYLTDDRFRPYRNELGADFRGWAEKNIPGAHRRFQVRKVGGETPPDVSNGDVSRVRVTFEIVVAYPQTHRYGPDNALDRDDVREQDWTSIDRLIGIYGRGNFSGSNDCTPLGAEEDWESGEGVDFLVVTCSYEYVKSVSNS